MNIHSSGGFPVPRKQRGLLGLFLCKCLRYKEVDDLHRSSFQYQFNILIID